MKPKPTHHPRTPRSAAVLLAGLMLASATSRAELSDGIVAYWPMDTVVGTKTPDLVQGYDMELANLTEADLVEGRFGRAFHFDNARQTLLRRIHSPGEQLPINQHPAFTIAMWANVAGLGLLDLRLFSEGSTENNDPLFNIGTSSDATTGQLDLFFRQSGWTVVNHIRTESEPLDGTWRHIVFVQQADGSRALYIDGVLDPLQIPAKEEGDWRLNTTTIGGILRANPTHWLTGDLDEVALWNRALTEAEIQQVASEGLVSVFPPLANGMVAYWPFDEVIGVKTPDLVQGYDMELANLTEADLIDGHRGKAFLFDNTRQTMLRRINSPGEQLPINQHPALTISFWANVTGTGLTDLRLFSEGSTANNDPLFNLGTASDAASGRLDFYFRQSGWTTVDHLRSDSEPLDGTWRHIVFVQQTDGTRSLYIDGQLDLVEIPPKEEGDWRLNTTTIGGILRANPTHWLTGAMDEVALWNRALSTEEIATLNQNGTPIPFSKPQPLQIRAFTADIPSAAVGDPITLRWDVTKNVQVSLDQGIGDVSAQTISGLGSITVNLDRSRTYTLTVTRGEETVSQSVNVYAIPDIASGWTLIDNFDRYPEGGILGNGSWLDVSTTGVSVVDVSGNKMLAPNNGDVVAVLPLRDLTISEGQRRTLFFRVYVRGDDAEAVNGIVGVTDRKIRFGNEQNSGNVGPSVIISDEWGIGAILGANYGFPFTATEYAVNPEIVANTAFDVWIDIINDPIAEDQSSTGDTFTVHVQRSGTSSRTTILENYISDRNPVGAADVGFTTPHLDSILVGGRAGHSATQNLLIDDIYLSKDGFNNTVPRAFGPSEPVAGDPPGVSIQLSGAEIEINWTGSVLESSDRVDGGWTPVAGAASPHRTTAEGSQRFFRARE